MYLVYEDAGRSRDGARINGSLNHKEKQSGRKTGKDPSSLRVMESILCYGSTGF
jgi:hypothetical protein